MDLEKLLSNETVSVKAEEDEDSKEILKPTPISNLTLASTLYESLVSLYSNPTLLSQLNSAILSQSLLNPLLFPSLDTTEDENKETPKPIETRNKKYISKTESGFMCSLCKKIYGRYNSVSYHVTIYHRNPPIKCGMPGCDFTTREARYIHFHKYYRHGIDLPESIDLGSRRCPYCRHVSKSPAMLEKHMARHEMKKETTKSNLSTSESLLSLTEEQLEKGTKSEQVTSQSNSPLVSDRMEEDTESATSAEDTESEKQESTSSETDTELACTECEYRSHSSSLLTQHILFTHSSSIFNPSHPCLFCSFTASSPSLLTQHTLSHLQQ